MDRAASDALTPITTKSPWIRAPELAGQLSFPAELPLLQMPEGLARRPNQLLDVI